MSKHFCSKLLQPHECSSGQLPQKKTDKRNNYHLRGRIHWRVFTSPDVLVRTVTGQSWNIYGLELFRSWDHLNLKIVETQRHPLTEFRIRIVVTEVGKGGGSRPPRVWNSVLCGSNHHQAATTLLPEYAPTFYLMSHGWQTMMAGEVMDQEDASQQMSHSGIFRSRKWAWLILIWLGSHFDCVCIRDCLVGRGGNLTSRHATAFFGRLAFWKHVDNSRHRPKVIRIKSYVST